MTYFATSPFARTATALLATGLFFSATAAASAGEWRGGSTAVGPYGGTWTSWNAGGCYGGVCRSKQTIVGPYGGVTTRYGSTSCNGYGVCRSKAMIVGPYGGVFTRTSTFRRY